MFIFLEFPRVFHGVTFSEEIQYFFGIVFFSREHLFSLNLVLNKPLYVVLGVLTIFFQ